MSSQFHFKPRTDWLPIVIGGGVGLLFAFMVWLLVMAEQDRKELVRQCVADGRKPYECEAMFRSSGHVVPVVAPVRVGR